MIEKVYQMTVPVNNESDKVIERIIQDQHMHYNHMLLNKGEALPEHFSNSNVYMTVVRGKLTIQLSDQDIHEYEAGTILVIPVDIKMNVGNKHDELLELIVIKTPAPQ